MFACSREFAEEIRKAIMGEAEAISFYRRLYQMTRCEEDREIIGEITRDEERHYRTLYSLYQSLTGQRPEPERGEGEMPENYLEGLFEAVEDETEAADSYSELYVATQDLTIRDLLYEITIDELRHASLLNLLYAKHRRHHEM